MKKIYKEPKEIVIELGMEGQLLQGIVSGNGPSDDEGLDHSKTDPNEGEGMSARTHGNLWDSQW